MIAKRANIIEESVFKWECDILPCKGEMSWAFGTDEEARADYLDHQRAVHPGMVGNG